MKQSWPQIDVAVLSFLQRTFRTPLCLDAAFDCEDHCVDLVKQGFPDMLDETLLDLAAELMNWKLLESRNFKRVRLSAAHTSLCRLDSPASTSVQTAYKRISQTSPLFLIELNSKRKQSKYKLEAPDARARQFDAKRRKYPLLLAQVIMDAELPVSSIVRSLEDPKSGWVSLFAGRRANTLKNR